jgi:hypothetical protein
MKMTAEDERAMIARNKHMTYSEVLFLLPHLTVPELETDPLYHR